MPVSIECRLAVLFLAMCLGGAAHAGLSLNAGMADSNGSTGYRETSFGAVFPTGDDRRWSLHHDYRVFELLSRQGVPAASNGHVHRLSLGWSDRFGAWHLSLAPTLAVSSNVLRHPGTMRLDDWRLDGRIVHQTVGLSGSTWRWGVGVDDRFGDYAPWPLVQWQTTLGDALDLTLGLPSSGVGWRVAERWRVKLEVSPDGGQWQVRDASRTQVSQLEQERWRASLALQWRVSPGVALTSGVARYWDRHWSYRLEDGREAERTPSSSNAWFLTISWTLPGRTDS